MYEMIHELQSNWATFERATILMALPWEQTDGKYIVQTKKSPLNVDVFACDDYLICRLVAKWLKLLQIEA